MGAVTCFYLMFLMNFSYALGSLVIMVAIYSGLSGAGERGMVALFRGMLFQLSPPTCSSFCSAGTRLSWTGRIGGLWCWV